MPWIKVQPVVDPSVRDLCYQPYPLHRNGCPNYNKKEGCPPQAPVITETLILSQPVFAIYNTFRLDHHIEAMAERHPNWSGRQLRCMLYWQGKARKQLREEIRKFVKHFRYNTSFRIVGCPEAQGVNLTETMKNAGIELEWPPKIWAYQIVLAGKPHLQALRKGLLA